MNSQEKDLPHPAAATRIESWCEGLIEASWLAALATAPLLVNIYSQRSFDPNKAAAVRTVVLIMIGAWLVKVVSGGRLLGPPVGPTPALAQDWRWPVLAPAILFTLGLLASSILSLDPDLSWRGSYQRAQGTWTRLAYLAIFAAILTHLRRPAQLRRLFFVVMLAGLSVALYGVQQHLGLDPIPWATRHDRVGATMGNPIFFGAFLLMTWFITLSALAERFDPLARSRLPAMLGAGVLLYVVLLELAALAISQSRGPFLGLLAGVGVFALGALARCRRPVRRRLIGATALALVPLIWLLSETPFAGRLATLADPTTPTSRVRLSIWRGAGQILTSAQPLTPPGGEPDPLSKLRPWIGHGPETFALTFPRYHPIELSHLEKPGSAPDRAHNATFDVLVTLGVCGLLAWLWLIGGLCHLALVSLGRRPPGLALGLGAALGAALPWLLTGELVWVGVGLPAGSLLALMTLLASSLRGERQDGADASTGLLILALLATLVAHFVELHFSFAVTATELYFWALAALLVVVSQGWLRPESGPASPATLRLSASGEMSRLSPSGGTRGALAGCRAGLPAALVAGCLSFLFVAGLHAAAEGADFLSTASLSGSGAGVIWLLFLTSLGAIAIAPELRPAGWATFAGASLGPGVILAAEQVSRLRGLKELSSGASDLAGLSDEVSRHVSIFSWWLLAVVFATGLALGTRAGDRRPWARWPGLTAAAALAVALLVPWLAERFQLTPLRAGVVLKHSAALLDAGRGDLALELLSEAARLSPGEPMVFLMAARAKLWAARASVSPDERELYLRRAASDLAKARELAPLDPDHTVNLARLWVARGELASDETHRSRLYRRAAEEYRNALRLKPRSVALLVESAALAERRGEPRRARELFERALEIDPGAEVRLDRRDP